MGFYNFGLTKAVKPFLFLLCKNKSAVALYLKSIPWSATSDIKKCILVILDNGVLTT
jgi:hypothetical protein